MSSNISIAVVGGDRRELYLADYLVQQGYDIRLSGHEKYSPLPAPNYTDTLAALKGVDAVILPLAGVTADNTPKCPFSNNPPPLDSKFFAVLAPGTPVFVGWATSEIKEVAHQVELVEIANDDELAILNSIPTAEGTVAIAMQNSEITLHGSTALVLGFGRSAVSLARMLAGIGAEVTVAARNPADLARAHEMGFGNCQFSQLVQEVNRFDFIFNTVPALVLTDSVLKEAKRCQLIVDIASGQGGTDFAAAEGYGIKALLTPGLPGKMAPVTAGKILTKVYPRLLEQYGVTRR